MSDDLRPVHPVTGVPKDTPLVDDLAEVLSHIVVGWKPGLVWMTGSLDQHPAVVRVMARYRASKEQVDDPLVAEAQYIREHQDDFQYLGGQTLAVMVLERFGVKG